MRKVRTPKSTFFRFSIRFMRRADTIQKKNVCFNNFGSMPSLKIENLEFLEKMPGLSLYFTPSFFNLNFSMLLRK